MQFPLKFKYILPMASLLGNKTYILVGLVLIIAVAILAFFLFPSLTKEKETTITPSDSAEKTTIIVRVEEVNTEEGILTVLQLGNGTIYKVKVSEDLKISDSKTGESLGLENIKVGQTIKLILNSPPSSGSSGSSGGSDEPIDIDDPDEIETYPEIPGSEAIPKVG